MQRTRLNTLFDLLSARIEQFISNPWRRISLITISLLFGIYMGEAVSTTAGQDAVWDVTVAGIMLGFTEVISIIAYGRFRRLLTAETRQPFWLRLLNAFKIGLVYSLFLEAFTLGS